VLEIIKVGSGDGVFEDIVPCASETTPCWDATADAACSSGQSIVVTGIDPATFVDAFCAVEQ
jgi:hypothetical protein